MLERAWAGVDVIEELQLRRWARENYIGSAGRDGSWHPIVLEEMRRRDAELIARRSSPVMRTMYVPLAPAAVLRLDPGHESLPAPLAASHERARYEPEAQARN
ncbi:MAG: hypothetical protein ACREJB_03780 [Planctomycetaceae bacterium]